MKEGSGKQEDNTWEIGGHCSVGMKSSVPAWVSDPAGSPGQPPVHLVLPLPHPQSEGDDIFLLQAAAGREMRPSQKASGTDAQ